MEPKNDEWIVVWRESPMINPVRCICNSRKMLTRQGFYCMSIKTSEIIIVGSGCASGLRCTGTCPKYLKRALELIGTTQANYVSQLNMEEALKETIERDIKDISCRKDAVSILNDLKMIHMYQNLHGVVTEYINVVKKILDDRFPPSPPPQVFSFESVNSNRSVFVFDKVKEQKQIHVESEDDDEPEDNKPEAKSDYRQLLDVLVKEINKEHPEVHLCRCGEWAWINYDEDKYTHRIGEYEIIKCPFESQCGKGAITHIQHIRV